MTYLVDVNVLSEPTRVAPNPKVIDWARFVVELGQHGRTLPVLDSMIAATALVHGLTVATRNVRDFRTAGIQVIDPFV